jgi:hypothetical protein
LLWLPQKNMVDASTNKPTSSPEPQAPDVAAARDNASQTRPAGKANAAGAHLAAAATIDELLAKEALANLKRTRATAHAETVKSKPRVPVPSATLVVKPPQSHAWMTPFITLAVVVGISTFLCTGGIAYLFLRPVAVAATSDAELRNMRESMAQLRRTVAALSNDLTANRTALDAANKAVSDRFGRIVQSLERVDRDQSVSATKIERMAEEKAQVVRTASTTSSPEITGTVQRQLRPTTARREVIAGWRVRRAFEGVAILEGQPGVIEVVLGQDVPNLGRIEEIKYENSRWQVLTSKGVILPAR